MYPYAQRLMWQVRAIALKRQKRIYAREAVELFFETASPEEIKERLHDEVYVSHVEVAVG